MIYTITLNPSLDYMVRVADLKIGAVNRADGEMLRAGGKGINVSIMLKNLGIESTALGFVGGFTGEEICRQLEKQGIRTDFTEIPGGVSRINVKLRVGRETEINGGGPEISTETPEAEINGGGPEVSEEIREMEINGGGPGISVEIRERLFEKLARMDSGDILVLAGSIPSSLPDTLYRDILNHVAKKDVKVAVDASGKSLLRAVEGHPFLIKPNQHELGEIFGAAVENRESGVRYARKLQKMGAENVLVSLAEQGAFLLTAAGDVFSCGAPDGRLVNSVGAGDSMVAGFLAGYLERGDYPYALKMGVCAGSASAFCEEFAGREQVRAIMERHPDPTGRITSASTIRGCDSWI